MVTVRYSLWAKCIQLWPLKVGSDVIVHVKGLSVILHSRLNFFFFFFFCFSLFKMAKICFGCTKMKIFYREKSISRREKKSGQMTLPPQKNFPVTPLPERWTWRDGARKDSSSHGTCINFHQCYPFYELQCFCLRWGLDLEIWVLQDLCIVNR